MKKILLIKFGEKYFSKASMETRGCKREGKSCFFGFQCCPGLDCDGVIPFRRCQYDDKKV